MSGRRGARRPGISAYVDLTVRDLYFVLVALEEFIRTQRQLPLSDDTVRHGTELMNRLGDDYERLVAELRAAQAHSS